LTHGKKIISEQGIESFMKWILGFKANIRDKFDREMKGKKALIESEEFKELEEVIKNCCDGTTAHPKTQKLIEILKEYFQREQTILNKSKVMVFT